MINAYYPNTTPKIIHKGQQGNIYRLDGIEKCVTLYESLILDKNYRIIAVEIKSTAEEEKIKRYINQIHNPSILETYKTGSPKEIAETLVPMWQPDLYYYVLEQAKVSIESVLNIIQGNNSLVITGGGHHAEKDSPFGFCPINTMAISALESQRNDLKTAIIDLDIHYSNGCFDILKDEENIKVYSLWNQKLDKWKYFESEGNIWHRKVENINDYFSKLEELLLDVKEFKPDLVIYHLGLDPLETDRMGGVKGMTYEKLFERDLKIKDLILNQLNSKFIIFIGGSYIDRTMNEENITIQKENATALQKKILEKYSM